MGSSRRGRRRRQRQIRSRPGREPVSLARRLGLVVLGVLMIAAGVVLVAGGSAASTQRLGRLAGILIVIGLVLLGVAALGYR